MPLFPLFLFPFLSPPPPCVSFHPFHLTPPPSPQRYTVKQLTALCTINTGVLDRKRKDRQDQAKRVEELLTRVQHVDPPPVV